MLVPTAAVVPPPDGPQSETSSAVVAPTIPTPSGWTPSAPEHGMDGRVSLKGSGAWWPHGKTMTISYDGGRSWRSVALPAALSADDVDDTTMLDDATLWLTVRGNDAARVYSLGRTSSAWTRARLQSVFPALTPGEQERASFNESAPGLLSLTLVVQSTMNSGSSALLTSADGLSFTAPTAEKPSDNEHGWAQGGVQLSRTDAVTVIAPGMTFVYWTGDGGVTWSPSLVAGRPPADGRLDVMRCWLDGPRIEFMAAIVLAGAESSTYQIYASDDRGRTFRPLGPSFPEGAGMPVALGASLWMAPYAGGAVDVTYDGGATWRHIETPTLPGGVLAIGRVSETSATAAVEFSGCITFKDNCWNKTVLYATTDDGRTWSALPLPAGAS
jgi:hypothetical protein